MPKLRVHRDPVKGDPVVITIQYKDSSGLALGVEIQVPVQSWDGEYLTTHDGRPCITLEVTHDIYNRNKIERGGLWTMYTTREG